MQRHGTSFSARGIAVAAALTAGMLAMPAAHAQTTRPAAASPSLLQQLDRESRSLYTQTQRSVARVQLPPPRWVIELTDGADHPVRKWGKQLDPDVQQKLTDPHRRVGAVVLPGTQPTGRPGEAETGNQQAGEDQTGDDQTGEVQTGDDHTGEVQTGDALDHSEGAWRMRTSPDGREVTLESSVKQGEASLLVITPQVRDQQGAGMRLENRPAGGSAPNNIAIILDDQGHLLVPIYLEREQLPQPVPVRLDVGQVTTAAFVGSDRQTNLTVLKCRQPVGEPAILGSSGRPGEGALVMLLSPTNDNARLSVWTGGANEWGVVVALDGRISGFARHNQFLPASLAMPVVRQLIDTGRVERPQLGMLVHQVPPDDPQRQSVLGKRPAMRIQAVFPGTPAASAGLRKDDLILTLRDQPVGDVPSLAAVLCGPSGATPLTILRGEQEQTVTLELEPAGP